MKLRTHLRHSSDEGFYWIFFLGSYARRLRGEKCQGCRYVASLSELQLDIVNNIVCPNCRKRCMNILEGVMHASQRTPGLCGALLDAGGSTTDVIWVTSRGLH